MRYQTTSSAPCSYPATIRILVTNQINHESNEIR